MLGFWDPRRMCLFNVLIFDIDTDYYDRRHPHKILYQHEQRKKVKYLEAYLEQQCHFTPIVFSVDGVMWKDIEAESKQLGAAMSKKMGQVILSNMWLYLGRISLDLFCAFSFLVWGLRSGNPQRARHMPEDGV